MSRGAATCQTMMQRENWHEMAELLDGRKVGRILTSTQKSQKLVQDHHQIDYNRNYEPYENEVCRKKIKKCSAR